MPGANVIIEKITPIARRKITSKPPLPLSFFSQPLDFGLRVKRYLCLKFERCCLKKLSLAKRL
jgi:hypothetical protein